MKRGLQGHFLPVHSTGEKANAFVPTPLPPKPSILWSTELQQAFNHALLALGRLDSISLLLPDTSIFLYMYVRREAVLSSQIEGTQSSLSDLLIYELDEQPGVPFEDVQEVSNYVAALNLGMKRIDEGNLISLRLIKELHTTLLSKGRGSKLTPGEFRRSQNWIGGTRPGNATFVPPPPDLVLEAMGKLELFIHDQPEKTPTLLKVALVHLQFESIHPFLDGNGRIGRLLISLLLYAEKVLHQPLLYLSLYLKVHRKKYYELLDQVRISGTWEIWLEFFAGAVTNTANQAVQTAQSLTSLAAQDAQRLNKINRSGTLIKLHKAFLHHPIATASLLVKTTELSVATVHSGLSKLEELQMIQEVTGKKRNQVFSYQAYVAILNEGTAIA